MEYDPEKTGVLFKNDNDNPKAPQYKGKITFDGVEYQLAAWVRESANGVKFMSLKAEPPFEQRRDTSQSDMTGAGNNEPKMGDSVPF